MRIMTPILLLLVLGLSLTSLSGMASTFLVTTDELDPDVFPQVADSIRVNLDGPNAPLGLSSARKKQALNALDAIERYLEEDPVANASRIRNAQRRFNAALAPQVARHEIVSDSEMVCKRVKKAGTHIPSTECTSREEMEREEYLAEETIRRLGPKNGGW